jgi:hypothetical protein
MRSEHHRHARQADVRNESARRWSTGPVDAGARRLSGYGVVLTVQVVATWSRPTWVGCVTALRHKRSLALREYALGLEGLDRGTRGELLWRVHGCVFGDLALESKPADLRL